MPVPGERSSSSPRLADLQEVTIRVAEEAAHLPVVVDGRGEKLRTPRSKRRVGRLAVRDTDGHLVTDGAGIDRRGEANVWLVFGRFTAGDQQQPGRRGRTPGIAPGRPRPVGA